MRIQIETCTAGKSPGSRYFTAAGPCHLAAGYSLIEVVMALAVIMLVYGAIIACYIQCGLRSQWSGYSLAAQSLSIEEIERARSATWDPSIFKNELTNNSNGVFTNWVYTSSNSTWSGYNTAILDVPYSSTNFTIATNFITVQMINISTTPLVQVQMIRVDTVWPFYFRPVWALFTNTSATILAPDNRDFSAM